MSSSGVVLGNRSLVGVLNVWSRVPEVKFRTVSGVVSLTYSESLRGTEVSDGQERPLGPVPLSLVSRRTGARVFGTDSGVVSLFLARGSRRRTVGVTGRLAQSGRSLLDVTSVSNGSCR